MKRVDNIYHNIADIRNIISMYNKKVRVTTKNKRKIENFSDYYTINISNIEKVLTDKIYTVGKYNIFLISEPKIRVIMSQNIKDKLVNHLVAEHFLIKYFEKELIDENVATRKNKGTKYGIDLTKKYLNEIKKETTDIYFLKFDISKYFYSIDHEIVKKLIRKKIKDKDALNILDLIIDSTDLDYVNERINKLKDNKINKSNRKDIIEEVRKIPTYEKGKGLPIGNMTSQFLAIYYLNDLDHFIKEKLRIKHYIRYMDDGIILHHNKAYLKYCLKEITNFVHMYKLKLNQKTKINHIKNGLDFLGFRFYVKNNKIVMKVRNSTKRRFKHKMKKYNNKVKHHTITKKEYFQYIASYEGHLKMGNNFYLLRKNVKYKKVVLKKKPPMVLKEGTIY